MEIFAQIVIPIITFFTGLLSKIVYDRFSFFSKGKRKREIQKVCPKLYISRGESVKHAKSVVLNSRIYKVDLKAKPDENMKEQYLLACLLYTSPSPRDS